MSPKSKCTRANINSLSHPHTHSHSHSHTYTHTLTHTHTHIHTHIHTLNHTIQLTEENRKCQKAFEGRISYILDSSR
jgi:hypothetical protein